MQRREAMGRRWYDGGRSASSRAGRRSESAAGAGAVSRGDFGGERAARLPRLRFGGVSYGDRNKDAARANESSGGGRKGTQ